MKTKDIKGFFKHFVENSESYPIEAKQDILKLITEKYLVDDLETNSYFFSSGDKELDLIIEEAYNIVSSETIPKKYSYEKVI